MTKVVFANGPLEGTEQEISGEAPIQMDVPVDLSSGHLQYIRVGFAGDGWIYTFAGGQQ